MNERKATKRALLTSITALVMCVVMLAGTTFAWFTDTAKTNVNRIEAGKLDVALEMQKADGTWENAEGKTLNWVKATAGSGQTILWEPGATYELPKLRVVNNGNLALKYEIKITGTQGDAKLLEAIEFYVNDATTPLTSDSIGTGTLMPKDETGDISSAITIKGHMKESAKNEYQGLSLDGIAITVYATQAIYEYDSSSNTYDNGAFDALDDLYPVSKSVAIKKDANGNKQQAVINDADNSGKKTYEVIVPGDAMADDADNISVTVSKAASVDTAKFSVDTTGNKLEQFDVTVSGIKNGNTTPITVELFIGKGYTFTSGVPVKHLKGENVENLTGTYNASTGCVTFKTTSFSPFAVEVPDMAAAIGAGHELTYYYTLADAVEAVPTDGTETTITLLNNAEVENYIAIKDGKNIVLDLNSHDVVHNGECLFDVYNAKFHVTGEGTLFENVKYGYAPIIARGSATDTADYTVITIDKNVTLKGDYTGIFVAKDAGNGYHNYGLVINMFGTIDMGAVTDGFHYSGMYVNGRNTVSDGNNVMTINLGGATIKNCAATGIYAAGYAKWNITNSSITSGNTGIEIRAGELTVNGATVVGNGVPTEVTPNGNGSTTEGAGIAVAQHTSQLPIKVTINSGDISGYSALYQSNPQKNDAESVKKVSVAVNGGMFKTINGGTCGVYSENNCVTISGGTFSSDPSNYLAEDCTATKDSNDVWTVAKS